VVCSEHADQIDPDLVDDSANSVIVTWRDARDFGVSSYDLFAQRLGSAGSLLWTAGGVAVSTAAEQQWKPQMVGASGTGAIVVWEDRRDGHYDVYAQKVFSNGDLSSMIFEDGFESGETTAWSQTTP
jgi:hypothetical protein